MVQILIFPHTYVLHWGPESVPVSFYAKKQSIKVQP